MEILAVVGGALIGSLFSFLPIVGKFTSKITDSAKKAAVSYEDTRGEV